MRKKQWVRKTWEEKERMRNDEKRKSERERKRGRERMGMSYEKEGEEGKKKTSGKKGHRVTGREEGGSQGEESERGLGGRSRRLRLKEGA